MIQGFEAKNFGCLRSIALELSAVHAFIGPNDSGKTTILRAVASLSQLASRTPTSVFLPMPRDRLGLSAATESGTYSIAVKGEKITESIKLRSGSAATQERALSRVSDFWDNVARTEERNVLARIAPCAFVRFDSTSLKERSQLIPESQLVGFLDSRGKGLPGIYQAILGRGDKAFMNILEGVQRLFPTVERVAVPAVSHNELVLEVKLKDGTKVQAAHLSDGLLYYLAFAAIPYLSPVKILLIEEPENGLHPARIRDVMNMLRAFAEESGTQVLLATHSPLIVNELRPNEVTVVTRDVKAGTRTKLIKDTPNFERRSRVAELGELWVSYADGVDENPLLHDPST